MDTGNRRSRGDTRVIRSSRSRSTTRQTARLRPKKKCSEGSAGSKLVRSSEEMARHRDRQPRLRLPLRSLLRADPRALVSRLRDSRLTPHDLLPLLENAVEVFPSCHIRHALSVLSATVLRNSELLCDHDAPLCVESLLCLERGSNLKLIYLSNFASERHFDLRNDLSGVEAKLQELDVQREIEFPKFNPTKSTPTSRRNALSEIAPI